MKIGSSLLTEGEALRGAPKLFDFAILSLYYECLRSIFISIFYIPARLRECQLERISTAHRESDQER